MFLNGVGGNWDSRNLALIAANRDRFVKTLQPTTAQDVKRAVAPRRVGRRKGSVRRSRLNVGGRGPGKRGRATGERSTSRFSFNERGPGKRGRATGRTVDFAFLF